MMIISLVNFFFVSFLAEASCAGSMVGRLSITPPYVSNHTNLHLLPNECGMVHSQNDTAGDTMVANLFDFPWMALLGYEENDGKITYKCVGSVITARHILTVAHYSRSKAPKIVRLGEYNITSDRDCVTSTSKEVKCAPAVQDILVEKISLHPQYNTPKYHNDIALVRLVSDIQYNDAVSPICLPITRTAINTPLTAVGWGTSTDLAEDGVLMKEEVEYVTPTFCRSFLATFGQYSFEDKRLCIGYGRKDSCGRGSGNALLSLNALDNGVKYIQIGLGSLKARFCGTSDFPGVYTNVAEYMDWILDNLE